jgi:hypothetical protein
VENAASLTIKIIPYGNKVGFRFGDLKIARANRYATLQMDRVDLF